nr:hypothetical protein [Tanacetum cinerariifolium]
MLLKLSLEVRPLGAELRPVRDELGLLGVGARLHGTKDKQHRSEARERRLDQETTVMMFGRLMFQGQWRCCEFEKGAEERLAATILLSVLWDTEKQA